MPICIIRVLEISQPPYLVPRGFDKITISYDRFLESHFRTAPSLIILARTRLKDEETLRDNVRSKDVSSDD